MALRTELAAASGPAAVRSALAGALAALACSHLARVAPVLPAPPAWSWAGAALAVALGGLAGSVLPPARRSGGGAAAIAAGAGGVALAVALAGDAASAPAAAALCAVVGVAAAALVARRGLAIAAVGCGALLATAALALPTVVGDDAVLAAGAAAALLAAAVVGRAPSASGPQYATWRRRTANGGAAFAVAAAAAWAGPSFVGWSGALGGAVLAVAIVAAAAARPAAAMAAAALAGAIAFDGAARRRPPAGDGRLLAVAAADAAVFVRSRHERRWLVGDDVREAVGPERTAHALAATLVRSATRAGDRVLVLGGSGRQALACATGGDRVVDLVDDRPHAKAVRAAFAGDGPVAPAVSDLPAARTASFPAALRSLPAGARQAIVVGVLPTPGAPHLHADVQRELARVAGGGVVVQPIAGDASDVGATLQLCAAAAAAFPWLAVVAVGADAVLVGAGSPWPWRASAPVRDWPVAARWLAHAAHIGDAADLDAACLGLIDAAGVRRAAASRPATAAGVLATAVAPSPPSPLRVDSLFAAWTAQQSALHACEQRLFALADDADGRAEAGALAARFLPIGAPRALLQAALAASGRDGLALASPTAAARAAAAIDPCWRQSAPAVLAWLPEAAGAVGALEDLAALPPPARLAELAAGDDARAIALRARFPTAAAQALVAALAKAPLPPAAQQALRELADPFVLREAAAALAPAGRLRELLGLWRGGLPMPPELVALAHGSGDDRRALAVALTGRREPTCAPALAELLVADEADVRGIAASALAHQFPGRVAYDPSAPLSERRAAAARVRSLHNRTP